MALANVSDAEILAAISENGSQRAAARHFDVAISTFVGEISRRGLTVPPTVGAPGTSGKSAPRRWSGVAPQVTRESLHAALVPPNTCKVKQFLDTLDDESREVVEEALGYKSTDLSSSALRTWLIGLGFKDADVPSNGSISDHRNGRRPCRCSD